jgi:hypothetical protein
MSLHVTRPELGIIEPCLPSPAKAPPSGTGWLHEIKHDGFRIMARRDGAGVRLDYSRGVYVRPRPRSRISAYSALPPSTEAFTLTLLIVPLMAGRLGAADCGQHGEAAGEHWDLLSDFMPGSRTHGWSLFRVNADQSLIDRFSGEGTTARSPMLCASS